MRNQALFLDGNLKANLEEVLRTQALLPDQILFIQPATERTITYLRDETPSVDDPVTLYASVAEDTKTIYYSGQVVGWEDKQSINPAKREVVENVIAALQPSEVDAFDRGRNLVYVRRLSRLSKPFPKSDLIKISDGKPLLDSPRPGGFSYVRSLPSF